MLQILVVFMDRGLLYCIMLADTTHITIQSRVTSLLGFERLQSEPEDTVAKLMIQEEHEAQNLRGLPRLVMQQIRPMAGSKVAIVDGVSFDPTIAAQRFFSTK